MKRKRQEEIVYRGITVSSTQSGLLKRGKMTSVSTGNKVGFVKKGEENIRLIGIPKRRDLGCNLLGYKIDQYVFDTCFNSDYKFKDEPDFYSNRCTELPLYDITDVMMRMKTVLQKMNLTYTAKKTLKNLLSKDDENTTYWSVNRNDRDLNDRTASYVQSGVKKVSNRVVLAKLEVVFALITHFSSKCAAGLQFVKNEFGHALTHEEPFDPNFEREEVFGKTENVYHVAKKKGPSFKKFSDEDVKMIDAKIEKSAEESTVTISSNLKSAIKRRFLRLVEIMGPFFKYCQKTLGIEAKSTVMILHDEILGLKVAVNSEGDIQHLESSVVEKTKKWMADYHFKLVMNITNSNYRDLCRMTSTDVKEHERIGLAGCSFTPLSTIHKKLNDFLIEKQEFFSIVKGVEKDGKGEEHHRHAGIQMNVLSSIKSFIELNPEKLAEAIVCTKKELETLKKDLPKINSPGYHFYKDRRLFKTGKSIDKRFGKTITTTIRLGVKHDGAKNLSSDKVTGFTDRNNFELGLFNFVDVSNMYDQSFFMPWMLLWMDLTGDKMKKLAPAVCDVWRVLNSTHFVCEMPQPYASMIDPTYNGDKPILLDLSFCQNWCLDQKAMKFYVDVTGEVQTEDGKTYKVKSISPRVKIMSNEKCKPYFKDGIDLSDVVRCPSSKFVKKLEDMFFLSYNLKLLRENPQRVNLKWCYDMNEKSSLLNHVDRIIDQNTDPLHGIISLMRYMLNLYEKLFNLLVDIKVIDSSHRKEFYKYFIEKNVYQYNTIFGDLSPFEVEYDFTKKLKKNANRNTIKAMKYKKVFSDSFVSGLFDLFPKWVRKDGDEQTRRKNNNLIFQTKSIFKQASRSFLYFCRSLRQRTLFTDSEIDATAVNFDLMYVFFAFSIQISGTHSNYVLEWLTVLSVDLFFKRNLSKNSMDIPELFNMYTRRIIRGNTTKFKKIGKRDIEFGVQQLKQDLNQYLSRDFSIEKSHLDVFSNMAMQVLLPLQSKTANVFFGEKEEGVKVTIKKGEDVYKDGFGRQKNPFFPAGKTPETITGKFKGFYDECSKWVDHIGELCKQRRIFLNFENFSNEAIEEMEYAHQKEFVQRMIDNYEKKNQLLCWEPGVGKSLPIIHFCTLLINQHREKNCFVVFPAAIRSEWKRKFKKWDKLFNNIPHVWFPRSLTEFKYRFGKKRRGKIICVSQALFQRMTEYELIKKDGFFKNCSGIFIDEIHKIAQCTLKEEEMDDDDDDMGENIPEDDLGEVDLDSVSEAIADDDTVIIKEDIKKKKLKCVRLLMDLKKEVLKDNTFIVGITGTPFRNDNTLLNISNFLWDTKFTYDDEKNIVDIQKNKYYKDSFSVVEKLKKTCSSNTCVRTDTLTEDSDIKLHNYVVKFEASQAQIDALPKDKNGFVMRPGVANFTKTCTFGVESSMKLPNEWKKIKKKPNTLSKRKFLTDSKKFDFILDLVDSIYSERRDLGYARKEMEIEDGVELNKSSNIPHHCFEKILIVSPFPSILEQVQHFLVEKSKFLENHHFFKFTGEESEKKRESELENFKNSTFGIGLLSTKVGSLGLTITEARYMIQLHPNWDHTWMDQSIRRMWRIGQKRDVYNFILATQVSYQKIIKNNQIIEETVNKGEIDMLMRAVNKDALSRMILPNGNKFRVHRTVEGSIDPNLVPYIKKLMEKYIRGNTKFMQYEQLVRATFLEFMGKLSLYKRNNSQTTTMSSTHWQNFDLSSISNKLRGNFASHVILQGGVAPKRGTQPQFVTGSSQQILKDKMDTSE